MASKEFKDRLLQNILQEVNLNLLKWTTVTSDIDIFEIMTMLILYSRCTLREKLYLLFTLFCFDKKMFMTRTELNFMIGKICCAVAMTFQIKKSYVHDIAEELIECILPEKMDSISSADFEEDKIAMTEFIDILTAKLKDFEGRMFENIEDRIDNFSLQIRQDHLPAYLKENQSLLGKYKIIKIIPYNKIYRDGLLNAPTVFIENQSEIQTPIEGIPVGPNTLGGSLLAEHF